MSMDVFLVLVEFSVFCSVCLVLYVCRCFFYFCSYIVCFEFDVGFCRVYIVSLVFDCRFGRGG